MKIHWPLSITALLGWATPLLLIATTTLPQANAQSFGQLEDHYISVYCSLIERGWSREKAGIEFNIALLKDPRLKGMDIDAFTARIATGIALFCSP